MTKKYTILKLCAESIPQPVFLTAKNNWTKNIRKKTTQLDKIFRSDMNCNHQKDKTPRNVVQTTQGHWVDLILFQEMLILSHWKLSHQVWCIIVSWKLRQVKDTLYQLWVLHQLCPFLNRREPATIIHTLLLDYYKKHYRKVAFENCLEMSINSECNWSQSKWAHYTSVVPSALAVKSVSRSRFNF